MVRVGAGRCVGAGAWSVGAAWHGVGVARRTLAAPHLLRPPPHAGAVGHGGHYHSQSPEAFFTHIPGVKASQMGARRGCQAGTCRRRTHREPPGIAGWQYRGEPAGSRNSTALEHKRDGDAYRHKGTHTCTHSCLVPPQVVMLGEAGAPLRFIRTPTQLPVSPPQVVMPSGPREAKGLLLASIREPDPVVFFEAKMLYRTGRQAVTGCVYFQGSGRGENAVPDG